MTDNRHVQVEEICLRALDLGPAERVAFVAHACRGDDHLRREIESLLAHRETAERFTLAPPTAITLRLDATCWQTFDVTGRRVVPAPGSPLAAGTIINGRYVIHGTLGIGGMGHVYRAVDSVADRAVALKRLVHDDVSPSVVHWLEAEFQTMAQFAHPNVAAVYDFAQAEGDAFGGHFFTMELVDGRNALSATDDTGISAIVDIAVETCRALAYLHSRDVVHHDLKPANVLVAADGHVKIVDFGISSVGRRASGTVRGTPFYMAPECFTDGVVDHRADFYSLGVMLYQLVYRRLPFVADDLPELIHLHASADLSFPTGADPANPLRPVIRRLIAKNQADRFTSGNDVIEAINAHTHTLAAGSSWRPRPRATVTCSRPVSSAGGANSTPCANSYGGVSTAKRPRRLGVWWVAPAASANRAYSGSCGFTSS
jgi:serine/threonine protein kinase